MRNSCKILSSKEAATTWPVKKSQSNEKKKIFQLSIRIKITEVSCQITCNR